MTNNLNTIAEELRTTAISKLPEAISVSEGDCILVVQNRKAKRARPSLFRGPKGDTGMAGAPGTPGTIGPTGASPVLRYTTRGIESKLSNQPDTEFTLLVPIADMTGPQGTTGANIVLRPGETGIEYKLSTEPDSAYRLLVPYSQITGPQGEPGKDFQILGYFDTLDLLKAGITTPNPGDAYGVGTAAPYPIYIWDAINQLWRDNGAIQGPAGRSGKSARVNTTSGYWEEFDDDTQAWKQTEAVAVYPVATAEHDGLMSKDDKTKLDQMKGGDVEVSRANVEKVLTGNIISHTHETERIVTGMPTDVWDGTTVSTALVGSGTVDDPYLIQSCADYIHFYRNPNLYGHAIEDEPSEEQKSNFKQMKFSSNLDFGNHPLDLGDAIIFPDDIRIEGSNKFIALVNIDGQDCRLSNINFLNTWGVIPLSMYCSIKNLHVISGIFTIPLSFIHDKVDSSEATVTPWGLYPGVTQVEDVSFVAELKFVGDIATTIMFVSGAIIISYIVSEYPGVIMGENPYSYSNITYSTDEGINSSIVVNHISAYVSRGDAPISVTSYDCTKALKEIPEEQPKGLAILMVVDLTEAYTLYINIDNALPYYSNSSTTPFHIAKTTAEMKSPEFLALLNGGTETFVADTENINDGYPIFKPRGLVETYDGYVKESAFEAFKTSVPTIPTNTTMSDGYYVNNIVGNIFETQKSLSEAITELGISPTDKSTNIINLDLDISGYMSRATEAEQTAIWGKMYTAPTNENIITLLGGAEGVRQLCEKLKPTNHPIVTVPYMLYFLPTRLISTSVSILIADSASLTNILSSPQDGCYINIALMFYTRINDPISIMVNLIIANFNTDTQEVLYQYAEDMEFVHIEDSLSSSSTSDALSANQGGILKERIDKKVGSEEITTIKKLPQAAYDALSSKDSKTLYACIQTNGTIVMR